MRTMIEILALAFVCTLGASPRAFAQHENETHYCITEFSDAGDIVYLVNYLFRKGPAPEPVAFAGNVDFKGGVDLLDVVYLVNYVFRNGPRPCHYCGWHRDPSDTRDAETIAMWSSDEITAPETLATRVQSGLQRIRNLPGASQTPMTSLRFRPAWNVSCIALDLDSATAREIKRDEYHAWDSLNSLYKMSSYQLDSALVDLIGHYHGYLSFEGIRNSVHMAESYSVLPGVLAARASFPMTIPECYLTGMYPFLRGDTLTVLFHLSCPPCFIGYENRYWYAAAVSDSAWIVGYWESHWSPVSDLPPPDAPAWWPYARENALLWYSDYWD